MKKLKIKNEKDRFFYNLKTRKKIQNCFIFMTKKGVSIFKKSSCISLYTCYFKYFYICPRYKTFSRWQHWFTMSVLRPRLCWYFSLVVIPVSILYFKMIKKTFSNVLLKPRLNTSLLFTVRFAMVLRIDSRRFNKPTRLYIILYDTLFTFFVTEENFFLLIIESFWEKCVPCDRVFCHMWYIASKSV